MVSRVDSTPVVTITIGTGTPGGGGESGSADGRPVKLVSVVSVVSISLGITLATVQAIVRGGGCVMDSNSGMMKSISIGMVETVVSVVRFGFSGPLGPGESPDGLADVAGATAGVGSEGLGFFISGSLANTLGRPLSVRETTSSMSSNTTAQTVVTIGMVETVVTVIGFGFSGTLSTEAKSLAGESGAGVSGPLEGGGVAYGGTIVAIVTPGFGGSHGSQSG